MIAAFCNGERIDALPLDSRAAHYGDGAFTTMRVHAGRIAFWPSHRQRLVDACHALHLSDPDWVGIDALLRRESAKLGSVLLKLALVPTADGRGYARVWPSPCDVYLFVHDVPVVDPLTYRHGLDLVTARAGFATDLAAGIKTLSRLDQVLVAPRQAGHDVLVVDRDGFVRSAQSGNVFALYGTRWVTPPVGPGAIAGVMRSMLLQSPPSGFSARVQVMHRDALDHADEVLLCNAVRGIVPVQRLDARTYSHRDGSAALMRRFHPELGLPEA
ncbi:MAG TPA: aminotransferase class IV [Patescibacteria group bacterium]|nr:aminotransferase class IV [Patescibacteria group bacterium]